MGNCINKASRLQQQSEQRRPHGERVAPEEREEEEGSQVRRIGQVLHEEEEEEVPETEMAAAGVKVKVVLTRAELEWLMAQLKSGEQRLEDVLHQMSTAARADDKPQQRDGWRPRLECILEGSEATAGVDAT